MCVLTYMKDCYITEFSTHFVFGKPLFLLQQPNVPAIPSNGLALTLIWQVLPYKAASLRGRGVVRRPSILSESLLCDTYVEEVICLGSRKAVKSTGLSDNLFWAVSYILPYLLES